MFQIGNPSLFTIGDPTIFLGYHYWLHKWLPDPPPEAKDGVLLSYIYALSAALSDPTDRSDLQGSVATLLTKHLGTGSQPAPQPAAAQPTTYTPPARVMFTRMRYEPAVMGAAAASLDEAGDRLVVEYLVTNMPPEGVYLSAELRSPSGVIVGSTDALTFPDGTPLDPAGASGSFVLERGSEAPEPGTWGLGFTVGTWMDDLDSWLLFTVV